MTKLLNVCRVAFALITMIIFVKTNANSTTSTPDLPPSVFFSDFRIMQVGSTFYWKTMDFSLILPPSESGKFQSFVTIRIVPSSGKQKVEKICDIKLYECVPLDTEPEYTPPTDKCLCGPRKINEYKLLVQQKAEMKPGKYLLKARINVNAADTNYEDVESVERELPDILYPCTDENPCNGHECFKDYKEDDTNDGQKKKREVKMDYKCKCEKNSEGFLIKNKKDWKKGKRCEIAHACSSENTCNATKEVCERKTNDTNGFHCVPYELPKLISTEESINNAVPSEAGPGQKMMLYQIIGWLFVHFAIFYFLQ